MCHERKRGECREDEECVIRNLSGTGVRERLQCLLSLLPMYDEGERRFFFGLIVVKGLGRVLLFFFYTFLGEAGARA